jgi:hypothetical protein
MLRSDGTSGEVGRGDDVLAPPSGVDPALVPLYANVASRLRGACAHMPAAEFQQLVLDIARMKLRWSGEHPVVTASMGEPRPTPSRDGRTGD